MTDREWAIDDRSWASTGRPSLRDPYIDSILATIAWFDLFDYPLTAGEVGKWRIAARAYAIDRRGRIYATPTDASYIIDVLSVLQELVTQGKLHSKWSFFFLPGREEIVETRQRRYLLAREKFARARKVARWFRFVPCVRQVAVCNTLGYSNAAEESDIDLFIVTAPGKIWTVRGLCLLFLELFHLRPLLMRFGASREERKDKIDLSFFVTEDAMDISSLILERERDSHAPTAVGAQNDSEGKLVTDKLGPDKLPSDPYLMYWLTQLTPLWDHGGVYQSFWNANEELRAPLPHSVKYETSPLRIVHSSLSSKLLQRVVESILRGNWIESAFKTFQLKKMPARLKELAGVSDGVVMTDTVLKFHDIDRRVEYRHKWIERLRSF